MRSLGRTLLALPCFILYSKAKFACYSRCFLSSYFCIPECLLPFPFVSRYFLISLHGWSAFFHPFTFSLCVSLFFFFPFWKHSFIYLFFFILYNIVLVLPYINMHPPRVYTEHLVSSTKMGFVSYPFSHLSFDWSI